MIVLSDMVKDIVFGEAYSDREKVLLLKKLMEPELRVDVYTERLAKLCDADKERAKERAERRREQNRQAAQRYRESRAKGASEPVSKVSVRQQASAGVSKRQQNQHRTDTDTDTDTLFSVSETEARDSITESNEKTEPIPSRVRTRGGGPPESGSDSASIRPKKSPAGAKTPAAAKIPAWTMSDDRLFSGEFPTVAVLRAALGAGCWRDAIDQLGEDVVLGEFAAFRAEVRAGEVVDNNAAAFTARLLKRGYVSKKRQFSGVIGSDEG